MFEFNGKEVTVPDWIVERNLDSAMALAWKSSEGERLVRETEKAVLVAKATDFGTVETWCPKSVLVTAEKLEEQREASNRRMEDSWRYTKYLRELAAENGVKIGNLSSWDKITAKLAKNGVSAMTRDEFCA